MIVAQIDVDLPPPESIVPNLVRTGTVVVVVVVMWFVFQWLVKRWVDRLVNRGSAVLAEHERVERQQRFVTLWAVIRTITLLALLVIAVLVVFGIWDIPIGPFVAVGTVVGVGVGLGAQDLVKSVIAGFMIIIEDQYTVGDVVSVAGVAGAVEAIKLRTTVLRDLEGNVHHIPNGEIKVASNLTQLYSATVIDVGVGYGEDVDHVIEVVRDEAFTLCRDEEWAASFLDDPNILGVDRLGDWSVQIRVVFTVVADQQWAVKREFLRRIKKRLDREGIEIPFPYRTVVLRPPDDQS